MTTLPDGWRLTTVNEVGHVTLGRQRHPNWHNGPEMRPYLRVANVFEDRIDASDLKEMDFSGCFDRYRLVPGDVLLNEGQTPELLGRPAIYRGNPPDVAFTNTLIRFQAGPEVLPEWALIVFRRHMHFGRFTRESRITTNIAHLSAARFKTVEFPVPPLDEQRRIVDILEDHLSRLDAAEDSLRLALRRLASYEAVALSLCRDGIENPLGDVTEIQGGIQKQPKRAPKQNAYPFLRVANVTKNGLDLHEVHLVELFDGELDRLRLQPGDLLVVEGNGSPSQIGRAALWDGSIADCVHQNHLIRVRPKSGLSAPYLEAVWNSPQNRRQLTDLSSSSSGLHTLSVSKLKSLKLPLPTLDRQRELVTEVQDVRDRRGRLDTELELAALRAQQLRRSLLTAAFSGRLTGRVRDIEVAEEIAGV
jgi:type I restriction enzyme S subunit